MSTTIYICVDIEDDTHHAFTDLQEFLEDFNETMETDYSTMEDFNYGENEAGGYRTIYKAELK